MVERINFVIIAVKTYDTIQQDLLTQPELLSLKQNKNIDKIRKNNIFWSSNNKDFLSWSSVYNTVDRADLA